ncbi:hypothetical protein K7B09_12555 [Thermomonas sp. RSS23]|uniref:Uncharacterized protein n=1 Tax=Thermomonas beijingensis TaxID=2872701 RepID=A0ABS7TH03_9GAMM|nr:hypothetical protein [Thermomonas beijingensis]MBZ4187152.1 hypothetical protein [Thermomonas beijingensis]
MRQSVGALSTTSAFVAAVLVALLAVPAAHCIGLGVGLSTRGTCAGTLAGYFAFGSIIAFPSALLFGVPLYLGFRKLDWLAWWQVALGAALAGALGAVALHALDRTTYLFGLLGLCSGLGTLAGLAFWYFRLRRHEP